MAFARQKNTFFGHTQSERSAISFNYHGCDYEKIQIFLHYIDKRKWQRIYISVLSQNDNTSYL